MRDHVYKIVDGILYWQSWNFLGPGWYTMRASLVDGRYVIKHPVSGDVLVDLDERSARVLEKL